MAGSSSLTVNCLRTIALVGRTGNGKSATGNSVLGKQVFESRARAASVTDKCQLETIVSSNGRTVNIIDTPGLFDFSEGQKSAENQIVRCFDLAKEGIDVFILVFSVRNRFSREELATFECLENFLGPKFTDYLVVLFTGGDVLEEDNQKLDEYLKDSAPAALQKILESCDHRKLCFNNKTDDKDKRHNQVELLFDIIEKVISKNNRRPYSNEIFLELQKSRELDVIEESTKGAQLFHSQQMDKIKEMVENKLEDGMKMLKKQLEDEQVARSTERKKYEEEIMMLQKKREQDKLIVDQRIGVAIQENNNLEAKIAQLEEFRRHDKEIADLKEQACNGRARNGGQTQFPCRFL